MGGGFALAGLQVLGTPPKYNMSYRKFSPQEAHLQAYLKKKGMDVKKYTLDTEEQLPSVDDLSKF